MIRCKQLQDASVILCLIYDNTLYSHEKIIFIFFIQQKIKKRQLFMFYEQNVQSRKTVFVYVDIRKHEIEENINKV